MATCAQGASGRALGFASTIRPTLQPACIGACGQHIYGLLPDQVWGEVRGTDSNGKADLGFLPPQQDPGGGGAAHFRKGNGAARGVDALSRPVHFRLGKEADRADSRLHAKRFDFQYAAGPF